MSTLPVRFTDFSTSILWRFDFSDRRVARRIHVHDLERMDVASRQLAIPKDEQIYVLQSTRRAERVPHPRWSLHYGDRNMGGSCEHQKVVRDRGNQQSLFLCGQLRIGVNGHARAEIIRMKSSSRKSR